MAKPTSKHRPEFTKYVGLQSSIDGKVRYMFAVPSKSEPGREYIFLVNEDGSAPYCSCVEQNEWAARSGCFLCLPGVAQEMAERGAAAAEGKPVSVGF